MPIASVLMATRARRSTAVRCTAMAVWVLPLLAPSRVLSTVLDVDAAEDVCPANADPCVVTEPIVVKQGAVLDFGTREVRVVPGGRIDIGSGVVDLRCGAFSTSTPGAVAISARGPAVGGGQDGGSLTIESRGRCSGSGAATPCMLDADCGSETCVKGAGVSIVGSVEAQGLVAGSVSIEAAGDVFLSDTIDLDSTDPDGDGGQLDVTSTLGAIAVDGRVEATSGRLGFGGIVTLTAAGDVGIAGILDASGGDFDGGEIDVLAGRNIRVGGRLHADSSGGEGSGGFVALTAGGSIALAATAVLSADGHQSIDNFAGDGGTFLLAAARDLELAAGASVIAAGARPDGAGGTFDVDAAGEALLGGAVSMVAKGGRGLGGSIAVRACDVELATSAKLENVGDSGENVITGSRAIVARAGATITADARSGTNTFRYRDASSPPLLQATIVPAPTLQVVPQLRPCENIPPTTTTTIPFGTCGNGILDDGEDCDDGDPGFSRGDACGPTCTWVACADPDASGAINASDALVLLRVAVALESCDLCVCNVDSSPGPVGASDALRVLSVAVGLPVDLSCPPCVSP